MTRPLVSFVISTWLYGEEDWVQRMNSLECTLASLGTQTYPQWEGIIVHNGPDPERRIRFLDEPRQKSDNVLFVDPKLCAVWCAPEAKGCWGHPWRLEGAKRTHGDVIGFVNDDTIYAPVYLERLVKLLEDGAEFAYCNLVHHGLGWQVLDTRPAVGFIDVACYLAKRELILNTPWTDYSELGDGVFVAEMMRRHQPVIAKDPGVLILKG